MEKIPNIKLGRMEFNKLSFPPCQINYTAQFHIILLSYYFLSKQIKTIIQGLPKCKSEFPFLLNL